MSQKYMGLTSREVEESRSKHGLNVLTPPAKDPLWKQFLQKFKDPLIIVLSVAGVLSIAISFYEYLYLNLGKGVFFEPIGIISAIFLATGVAFVFELRAEKEFAVLNKVNDEEPVEVIRDGAPSLIPKKDVVVGDIVVLTTGMEIPADGDLLECVSMGVDESTLTGEPMARKTTVEADFDKEATFPSDRVMRGTKVIEGHGVMRVDAVGDATENGKVFVEAQFDDGTKTPLDEQLSRLSRMVTVFSYIVASVIVVARIGVYFYNVEFEFVSFVQYLLATFMIAVALIVVSVPEGLPMAVTLCLAYSMRRMLKTNNLVRKLHACETMGAATVICTDKTGTLTQNRMQVAQEEFYGNPPEDVVCESMALNSTASLDFSSERPAAIGNPTEGALLLWLMARGKDYRVIRESVKKVEELPFSTERKYMATVVEDADGNRTLYVKGAPEIVMSLCGALPEGVTVEEVEARLLDYQSQAMRTLGFAYKRLEDEAAVIADGKLLCGNLCFIGIAGISDPVRTDVKFAVGEVKGAGVDVKIVTGDTPGTAREIGRQIGIWNDSADSDKNITTGPEIAALTDEELRHKVEDFKIIARARPLDKKRLVEALKANGEVVAVTGDGTNDAPALKAANVGLSMGDGTSVAKEASDITIIDNSFASIGRAVMWGRSLYRNIQRFILFQLTVNVAACLIVLVGSFLGLQSPLTVTQMLWVNLIMDTFAAMALASLPPSDSVMREKPRDRNSFIITSSMWRFIGFTGGIFFLLLYAFLYYLGCADIRSISDIGNVALGGYSVLTPYEESLFFTVFVFLQFWNMFNARAFATGRSALHLGKCGGFLFIAMIILVGQILIVETGGEFFNVTPLSLADWLIAIGSTSLVLWTGELLRLFSAKRKV